MAMSAEGTYFENAEAVEGFAARLSQRIRGKRFSALEIMTASAGAGVLAASVALFAAGVSTGNPFWITGGVTGFAGTVATMRAVRASRAK